jgi:hypothetical protein
MNVSTTARPAILSTVISAPMPGTGLQVDHGCVLPLVQGPHALRHQTLAFGACLHYARPAVCVRHGARRAHRFTAMPCISNRALKSSVPAPMNARAGNSFLK